MSEDDLYHHSTMFDRLADVAVPSPLFDREYGAQLTEWELRLHREFMERVTARTYRIHGFVHFTRSKQFFLVAPSPWTHNGVFVYVPDAIEPPPDGVRIELIARRIANPRLLERSDTTVRAFALEEWHPAPLDILHDVDPPMSLAGLSRLLFEFVGMAEASKRVFARLFISSPPFEDGVGGFTTGVQATAARAQINRFFLFLRRILPPVLRGKIPKYRTVAGLPVLTRKTWRLDMMTTAESQIRSLCVDRRDPAGFQEVSLGALTTQSTASLPDVPLALASEDFWIETKNATDLRLPVLKTVITAQLLSPAVSLRSVTAGTKHVLGRIHVLRESFGLEDGVLGRGMLLDSDMLGRPLSTLRIARSTARASWEEKITAKDIKSAWDRVLEPALKEFLELTHFAEQVRKEFGEDVRVHKFNTKVWRALKHLDSGLSRDLGPTLQEIASESGMAVHEVSSALDKMKRAGVVYEPRPGHFRLV